MSDTVLIDGSILEGGGQIVRNAIAFSVLTKKRIKISKIRQGRQKRSGLLEQHLKGVELVRDMSRAKAIGATFGSTELEFHPTGLFGGSYRCPVKTAGNVTLLLQISLPCAIFADRETSLTLQGGTNCEMAPQVDYMTEVFRPNLEKFGATFDFDLVRRGYYPKGGGEVTVLVKPVKELQAVRLVEQGEVLNVHGWSFVAGTLPVHVANKMADGAAGVLSQFYNVNIERYKESPNEAPIGNCSGIILVAETSTGCVIGTSALGNRSELAEETGRKAGAELLNCLQSGACVDDYCQDQLIVLMALAKGRSTIKVKEVTLHTKTAIHIAELLTSAKFEIKQEGNFTLIECEGIAYRQ